MNVIIDRFEGDYVVCEKEDRTMMDIKKSKIPSIAKEGDVLSIDNDVISIDIEKTKKRLNDIEKLTKGLWE
ncbi:DUF3006 domain-containing protein [Clostridium estertheticum]|uniref:DUF3006 domain-containing protein n=1 Tax=Clostridium estertheticum TaxID=238834 RepID=A0AA47EMV1_9CLOT|nr:DUF3006 domain-containing protein [Clostridium estertheticum]MBU3157095.1 DUF3006 domain-containing protein [Clostridium estertheticum]MBU3199117.1 DUF3006 domain-containing protein [Clostridium estertheticum]WAG62269.1 DUF3006 domain-containing protein [Clostridium estertheticum]WAG63620.1 DUF3006 domain-containing protein [Clostridium estertheticum]